MTETLAPGETPFGKEWIIFGEDPGQKAEDLMKATFSLGMGPLPGICIGASFYDLFFQDNFLTASSTEVDVKDSRLPSELLDVNVELLTLVPPGTPIIIRSSARNEGVSGIYDSVPYVITGDNQRDIVRLWEIEQSIYASYHTNNAHILREGSTEPTGMGFLIQPIVGNTFGDYHMPVLSGVFTQESGVPLLRLAMGLGTKTVNIDEALVFQGKSLNIKVIGRALQMQREADVLHMSTGVLQSVSVDEELIELAKTQLPKIARLIDAYRLFDQVAAPYWEFAIDIHDDDVHMLQVHAEKQKERVVIELGDPVGIIVCEGTDVVNMGRKEVQNIVWMDSRGALQEDMGRLLEFNAHNKNYVLIVPNSMLSGAPGGPKLFLEHFSNAAAVIELQYSRSGQDFLSFGPDHTQGRGGTHFAKICGKRDILFFGIVVSDNNAGILNIPGEATDHKGPYIRFWQVDAVVTNSRERGRMEIISIPVQREFTQRKLAAWSEELRILAYQLPQENRTSGAFYTLSNCINSSAEALDSSIDIFNFVEHINLETTEEIFAGLAVAQDNLHLLDSYVLFYDGLEYSTEINVVFPLAKYLEKLIEKLETRLKAL